MIIELPDNIEFTSAYESKLIGAMLRDEALLPGHRILFTPKLFTQPEKQFIASLILDYYDEHDVVPDFDTVEQMLLDHAARDDKHRKAWALYSEILKYAAGCRIDDNAILLDKLRKHALSMGMIRAVTAHCSKPQVSARDLEALVTEVEDLQAKLVDQREVGTIWQDNWHKFLGETRENIVSTGWSNLDAICGGGVASGELILILAPPKVGKSLVCTALGVNFARLGMDVVHVSLEMNEREVMARYTTNILGMIPVGPAFDAVRDELDKVARQITSKIVVMPFPMRGCPVEQLKGSIRTLVKQKRVQKGKFVLIVDYPTIMQPISKDNYRHVVAESYSGCLEIAREMWVPCIAPMQANRQAWRHDKSIVDIENAAETSDPIRDAHMVWALRQTDADRLEGKLNIFVAASRHTSSREDASFGIDYARGRISPL